MKLIRFFAILIVAAMLFPYAIHAQNTTKYHEAPMLADMVSRGSLPSVDKRLPDQPLVVKPLEKVGIYGGTWHMATSGVGDEVIYTRTVGYTMLVRWNTGWTDIVPDVAKSFDTSTDGKVFTFHLRNGLKWSDGQPFTADDILFAVNDEFLNKDLYPSAPSWLVSGGKPAIVAKTDDYTVTFTFAAPNGLFLTILASPHQEYVVSQPKHYLSQFHAAYADKTKLDALVKAAGVTSWIDLFTLKGGWPAGKPANLWGDPNLPTLDPWMTVDALGPSSTQVKLVRNPYFYAVDPEGNQLPYIDNVVYSVAHDTNTMVLQGSNGQIDMQDRRIATNANRSVFFDNESKGGYHFYNTVPASSNVMVLALNLTNLDAQKRAIYQNKDFRIGLSQAINRQEMIDVVYVGQGKPAQVGPRPESPLYNDKLLTQYTQYDVNAANTSLDKVLPKKDADGFRLMPDGTRLTIAMEAITSLFPEWPQDLELIKGYWAKVGIDMQLVVEERTVFYDRKTANQQDANVWGGDGGLEVSLEPRWLFPSTGESNFAEGWQYWYNDSTDKRAIEPPADVKKQMDLFNQLKATPDLAGQNALMKQILDITTDQFYVIGIALPANGYGIVKNNMHNVPTTMLASYVYPNPGPTNTFTYFFDPAQ